MSEEDNDWHDPLHILIREQATKDWRIRKLAKLIERQERRKGKGKGKSRELPSLYTSTSPQGGSGGSWSSRGSWQAAASAWAASSWRGAEGAATVTRERATEVAVEVQTWTGSSFLEYLFAYRFSGGADISPFLILVCV